MTIIFNLNADAAFKLKTWDELKKESYKMDKNYYKVLLKQVRVISYAEGDRFLCEDIVTKKRIMVYLYGVDVPSMFGNLPGGDIAIDYLLKIKFGGKLLDVIVAGEYYDNEYDKKTWVCFAWLDNVNLNINFVKMGLGQYRLHIPKNVKVSWVDDNKKPYSIMDENYWFSIFIRTRDEAFKNQVGIWKIYNPKGFSKLSDYNKVKVKK